MLRIENKLNSSNSKRNEYKSYAEITNKICIFIYVLANIEWISPLISISYYYKSSLATVGKWGCAYSVCVRKECVVEQERERAGWLADVEHSGVKKVKVCCSEH